MSDQTLIDRTGRNLRLLHYVSEVPSHTSDRPHISKGSAGSAEPAGVDDVLTKYRLRLEEWNVKVEHELERAQKARPRRDEEPDEWAERVLLIYEGKSQLFAALREQVSRAVIAKVRSTHRRDPELGYPLDGAGGTDA